MLTAVLPPLLLAGGVALALERGLQPLCDAGTKRECSGWLLAGGLLLLGFGLLLFVVQRPWFSAALLCAFQLLLVLVNNAKYHSLREPFLVQDFEYFTDALKHPRLYLPFFGLARAVLALLVALVAVAGGLWLEPALPSVQGWSNWLVSSLAAAVIGILLLVLGQRGLPTLALVPETDLQRLGFWGYLWAYGRAARQPLRVAESAFAVMSAPDAAAGPESRPHLLVIQSESFFDPRPVYPFVTPDVLQGFDRIRAQAQVSGRLKVPAWGANTVRTECAFLTGLNPSQLGVHRFNPYHQLSKRSVPNLAATLKAQGYTTVCVHPYPASFYLRDRVFPRMGFDRFVGIEAFAGEALCGQYVGDEAVARKVEALLRESVDAPLFIFVITMENHGPLHLETPDARVAQEVYRTGQVPQGANDLTVYLRHLRNADCMVEALCGALKAAPRAGVLCWYGDHVPIMPELYQRYGEPDGDTEYLIWRSDQAGAELRADLPVERLAPELLRLAGLTVWNQSV